jgi:hypothetical protein
MQSNNKPFLPFYRAIAIAIAALAIFFGVMNWILDDPWHLQIPPPADQALNDTIVLPARRLVEDRGPEITLDTIIKSAKNRNND